MGGGGWTFFMGGWELVEVYFGCVGVCKHIYGWVGVGGHFLWVGGSWWRYILGGWGCVDMFMGRWGWVGVSGGIF